MEVQKTKDVKQSSRYVFQDWFDHELDAERNTAPSYIWNEEKKMFDERDPVKKRKMVKVPRPPEEKDSCIVM